MTGVHGVRAALLAGGLGERMGALTASVCKPLVPYAGTCRLVDFSIANAVRSGVPELVLMSLHREDALVRHLLAHWDDTPTTVNFGQHDALIRSGHRGPLPERPPEHGTADALLANADQVFAPGARDVLVQHADHVYLFDYAPMAEAHRASGAACTIGVQPIERRYVSLFGMVEVDQDQRVRALVEKPPEPTSDLIFTAFCLFRASILYDLLQELAKRSEDGWQHDISRDVLPEMIARGMDVRAYPITSYWADIGTVERYHAGQLALLDDPAALPDLPRTLPGPPPAVEGTVEHSMLHPGCTVEAGAVVRDSVLLPGARVRAGVHAVGTVVLADETLTTDRTGLAEVEA